LAHDGKSSFSIKWIEISIHHLGWKYFQSVLWCIFDKNCALTIFIKKVARKIYSQLELKRNERN